MKTLWLLLMGLLVLPLTMGLVGYDCGSPSSNVTTLSLLSVGGCRRPDNPINVTQKYVQLLQLDELSTTQIIQCKVVIKRTVYYCGMHSHISIVNNGYIEYIRDISREACQMIHRYGTYKLGNLVIDNIHPNSSITHSITLSGYLDNDGRCNGAPYSDPYGSWQSAVVQGLVTLTVQSYDAQVDLDDNEIHLRSGITCSLSRGQCLDLEGGYTFWSPTGIDKCSFNQYSVLYEGLADRVVDKDDNQVLYSLASNDITFALTMADRTKICGYSILRTEHPKLFIFETKRSERIIKKQSLSPTNMDLFAYVNSKFIYVERHIRTQIKELYRDVVYQRCNVERRALMNSLSIATQSPDEFAYRLMKGPGYMAVIAGEVVHIVQCVPVEVTIKHVNECYQQLPVVRGNKTLFLSPRTHILTNKGMQTTCNRLLPAYYQLQNTWYKILPRPEEAIAPAIMKPLSSPTWKYKNPSSLATSGIYSNEEIKELRNHIMFPMEKPAILNTVARGMMGQPVESQGGSIANLLDENALKKIHSAWESAWGKFMQFSTVSAGILGVIFIMRIVKLLIDTVIHGYALHQVYGWSVYMLGAIWDSVTHLLILLSRKESTQKPSMRSSNNADEEAIEVVVNPSPNNSQSNHGNEKNFMLEG